MNIEQVIQAYQVYERYPVRSHFRLRFGECAVRVGVSRLEVRDDLVRYFHEFTVPDGSADIDISIHQAPDFQVSETLATKPPDPGKTKIKEEFRDLDDGRIVRKRLTGMVFFFGRGKNIAIGPCIENLNQVVNFINNRYIEWLLCKGALLGHASGVAAGTTGLAIAGVSGAGKSTLALHLLENGLDFISNDRLIIEQNGERVVMHGVAKLPRINPGTALNSRVLRMLVPEKQRQRFEKLPPHELWKVENKYDVPIHTCYGPDRFVLSVNMSGLVILTWKPGTGDFIAEKVTTVDHRRKLMAAFMKPTGLFFYPGRTNHVSEATVERYIRLLAGIDIWEFSGFADFEAAARFCLARIEEKRVQHETG
ncbi:MAG: HprK-related kinase B [Thermodesulfobacteriota bacterium]|nr:HprK-related kinase B [Thermodesulfobacteriota bacterium]